MKIYDVNTTAAAAETNRAQQAQRTGGSSGQTVGSSTTARDSVQLSGKLSSLGKAIATDSSGRAAKVQALAAQYRSGTYQVNSQATSRGMIAAALAAGARS